MAATHKGGEPNLIGRCGQSGERKERAHGQVEQHRKDVSEGPVDVGRQVEDALTAGQTDPGDPQ